MLTMPLRASALAVMAFATVLLAGCNHTRMAAHWREPEVASVAFNRLFVVAAHPAAASRRLVEDALSTDLAPTPVVLSYRVLPEAADITDQTRIIAAAKAADADGIMILRLVADDTELVVGNDPQPLRPVGPYHRPPPAGWIPATIDSHRVVTLETSFYRVSDGTLAWTGVTRSEEPRDTGIMVRETVDTVRRQLRAEGLIP